jgi:hypothetical protein
VPRHYHLPRIVGRDHGDAVRADHVGERRDHLRFKRFPGAVFDQVRQRFRIGLGAEFVAARLERGPQRVRILDDAVVDEGDAAGAVDVRMGVARRRGAVRGPAGVGDAGRAVHRFALERLAQALDPSREPAHREAGVSPVHHRYARRVVTAVLEPAQSFEQDGGSLARADVADDAAHARGFPRTDRTA